MQEIQNAVLIQGATLADIEAMVNRAVDARMKAFYESIQPKEDPMVRRHDAARKLSVSLPTLDAYGRCGILHPKHIGGRVFYAQSELENYLINQKK